MHTECVLLSSRSGMKNTEPSTYDPIALCDVRWGVSGGTGHVRGVSRRTLTKKVMRKLVMVEKMRLFTVYTARPSDGEWRVRRTRARVMRLESAEEVLVAGAGPERLGAGVALDLRVELVPRDQAHL